jgi:hypothetical protein
MHVIPVDDRRLRMIVVNEPTIQMRDGSAVTDRDGRPMWQVDLAVIPVYDNGETGRVEAIQLGLPENGFPKNLTVGTSVMAVNMVAIPWISKRGKLGVLVRADAIKVVGGQAGLKATSAAAAA